MQGFHQTVQRCQEELAWLAEEGAKNKTPAWLMHLAVSDWEYEMEIIQQNRISAAFRTLTELHRFRRDTAIGRAIAEILNDGKFRNGYGAASDGTTKHHAYPGGLMVHTAEVVQQSMNMAWPHVDTTAVLLGALYHDWGKIHDYDAEGKKTEHYRRVRHVVASYEHWRAVASGLAIPADLSERVGHIILAHHGRREWGSPVEPQTEEALIVHYADMWSTNYGPGR